MSIIIIYSIFKIKLSISTANMLLSLLTKETAKFIVEIKRALFVL